MKEDRIGDGELFRAELLQKLRETPCAVLILDSPEGKTAVYMLNTTKADLAWALAMLQAEMMVNLGMEQQEDV